MNYIIAYISTQIKEHPIAAGNVSWPTGVGMGIWGILSNDQTVKFIASVGGLLGIALTCMSMYYKYKSEQKK